MQLTVESAKGVESVLFQLEGEFDSPAGLELRKQVLRLLTSGKKIFLIDLAATTKISDTGLNELMRVAARIRSAGGQLGLVGPNQQIQGSLEPAGRKNFRIFLNNDEARESLLTPHRKTKAPRREAPAIGHKSVQASQPAETTGPSTSPEATASKPRDWSSRYIGSGAFLEIVDPIFDTRRATLSKSPFLIGRGPENDLILFDKRISRACCVISHIDGNYRVEDRGNHSGVFVNGERTSSRQLHNGDRIDFGLKDSYQLVFYTASSTAFDDVLVQLESGRELEPRTRALKQLSLLLEATAIVRSLLPMEDILSAVVDRSIEVTGARRGALLEVSDEGQVNPIVARRQGALPLHPSELDLMAEGQFEISSVIKAASNLTQEHTWHGTQPGSSGKDSFPRSELRSYIPLLSPSPQRLSGGSMEPRARDIRGVLYLESDSTEDAVAALKRARSRQQEQVLHTLATQAAAVLTSARLAAAEVEQTRVKHELDIAHRIQQRLFPGNFKEYPHALVYGVNRPCHAVGGDYFDHMLLGEDRLAFVIADVRGKGLGAALVSTMLQGTISAMTSKSDPARVFDRTNRFMCEHSVGHVTLFFGILNGDGGLTYINAGHPPPLLVSSGRVRPELGAGCIPLGLMPDTQTESGYFKLRPGETLVLYTDGITEAVDEAESQFGIARLQDTVERAARNTVAGLHRAVINEVESFTGGAHQADDMTLLILRFKE